MLLNLSGKLVSSGWGMTDGKDGASLPNVLMATDIQVMKVRTRLPRLFSDVMPALLVRFR